MVSPSRVKHGINCKKCNAQMMVRADYIKHHSGVCMSCQKKGNKNALKHGDYRSRLYKIWQGLFHRRYRINPDVCREWHDYNKFKRWSLDNGYSDNLTIDRVDNSRGYSPENCQWISHSDNSGKDKKILSESEMMKVKRRRKKLGMTQEEYAKHIGVSRNTVQRAERFERNNNE